MIVENVFTDGLSGHHAFPQNDVDRRSGMCFIAVAVMDMVLDEEMMVSWLAEVIRRCHQLRGYMGSG